MKALEIEKADFEKLSKEDPLTGCLNRAGFTSVLTREQERLNKQGHPVSFVILDIDHFKYINDTYGHTTGDDVLSNLSILIQVRFATSDVLVRWGGENRFSGEPLSKNANPAEIIKASHLNRSTIPERKITCSFGVAEMIPDEDAKKLFDRADKALYASKESGRNRVTSASFKKTK